MRNPVFTGACPAIVTPFDASGAVNYTALEKLIDHVIEAGVDAICVCGTTGECSTLSLREHIAVVEHSVKYINHRVKVIAGAGSNDTSAAVLEGYDIEIVERHHNRKVDAPSGTALMLADAAASARSQPSEYIYDRHSVRQPRGCDEIGISSVRGGTIVGEHEVIFAGRDEVIELRHSAQSREIFASGALRAARFLAAPGRCPGLYSMSDLVASVAE